MEMSIGSSKIDMINLNIKTNVWSFSEDALERHDDEVRAELIEELRNRHLDDNSWCEYTVDVIADELEEIARKLNNKLAR